MERSNENPVEKYDVTVTMFNVKETVKDMEVTSKDKDNKLKVVTEPNSAFVVDVQKGTYELENNIISYNEGKARISGKLIDFADMKERRQREEKQKAAGMDR